MKSILSLNGTSYPGQEDEKTILYVVKSDLMDAFMALGKKNGIHQSWM